jgi:hypothetical protein
MEGPFRKEKQIKPGLIHDDDEEEAKRKVVSQRSDVTGTIHSITDPRRTN